jgi:hypothetical protein
MSRIRATLLGLALAAATAGAAVANDKEVRALTIPASACILQVGGSATLSGSFWSQAQAASPSSSSFLYCPLPLSNIRIGGTSATKISKFRVTYLDSDSDQAGPNVDVTLEVAKTDAAGILTISRPCSFTNTASGNPSVIWTRATKICNVTLQAGTFYSFNVILKTGTPFGTTSASFAGIDFPQ